MTTAVASADLPPTSPPRRRALRWLARFALTLAGLAAGLLIAEEAFSYRDGGAFPHLNMYTPDAKLGVRLEPGATERISFGGNPISFVTINRDGYRGADWPPPGKDDVVVVGDSQVFGLGVEGNEAFSAKLADQLHRTVINAGVPTYGPDEYRAVIAEQLATRHPRTVVLTINLVNDLFEAQHPNRERHAVWDGWAVRKENAPTEVTRFPGRDFLFRHSHLVFAYRKWSHGEPGDDLGVASEGTWRDVVATGTDLRDKRHALEDQRQKYLADVTQLHKQISAADRDLSFKISQLISDSELRGDDIEAQQLAIDKSTRSDPGDIVSDSFGEGSRQSFITADQLATAAAVRDRLRKELAAWAKAHRSKPDAQAALGKLDDIDQAAAKLSELDVQKLQLALEPPLAGYLRDVKQLVEHDGARLVVVILPIDVQVSADEWKKYGLAPLDMTASRTLNDELAATCRSLGLSVLDALPVLAAAEPGAFLDKDIHMTPKGHAAVASALAQTITAPPPPPAAAASVANGRSSVPLPEVFHRAPEVIVSGSSDAACETKQVREWLRIQCPITDTAVPLDLQITRDDGHEAMALVERYETSLLVPVVEGRELEAKFTWTDTTRVLHVRWPTGGKPKFGFDKPVARKPAKDDPEPEPGLLPTLKYRSPTEAAICWCWWVTFGTVDERNARRREYARCIGAYGAPDAACVASYGGGEDIKQCPALLACTRRDPAFPPLAVPATQSKAAP